MGDYKVRCDVSGLTYLRSECKFTWNGLLENTVDGDWSEKQPQLIIKPRQDKIAVADARPTPENDDALNFGEGNANDL